MEIPSITTSQIEEYNAKNAFAISRSQHSAASLTSDFSSIISTSSIQESLGLIGAMIEKMELLSGNIELIYNFSNAANRSSASDEDKQEAYAQIRSLGAGIDQLVNQFSLNDKNIFGGSKIRFQGVQGSDSYSLDSLNSSVDGGLGLATREDGAWAELNYDVFSQLKNQSSDIIGLDISEVSYTKPDSDYLELEEGNYYTKVSYQGEQSFVELVNEDGTSIEKVEDVDLTGTGSEIVKFENGIEIEFEKEYFETSLGGDKHDWEEEGTQTLWAQIKFTPNSQYFLDDDGEGVYKDASAETIRNYQYSGDTGSLAFTAAATGEVGTDPIDSGTYKVRVEYAGEKSSLWLYDNSGSLLSIKRGIDMTLEGEQEVDFENGIKVGINNESFTSDNKTYEMHLQYQKEEQAYENFNFDTFSEKVEDAFSNIVSQLNTLIEVENSLITEYQYQQQGLNSRASTSASVLAGQSLNSLLSSAIDTENNPLMTVNSASSSLDGAMDEFFTTMKNISTVHADTDPAILSRL